jgi:NTE family protein
MNTTRTKVLGALAVNLMAALTIGCATTSVPRESASLEPRFLAEVGRAGRVDVAFKSRPTIALALGGGGLRGYAHVGVLRALEEAGIRPDIVVGTSAGALVGAAYASGLTPDEIEAAAFTVKVSSLIDWTLSSSGLMRGDHLASWVDKMTAGTPIERFPVRFGAVATDLQSGRAVLIDRGSAGSAIRASAAVPGVTVPVAYNAGHLVDGGVASLVPVRFARAMGADIVIAVDIYCNGPRAEGVGVTKVMSRVMQTQSCLIATPEMAEADVLIAPAVKVPGMSANEEKRLTVRAGYEAARAALTRLL